MTKKEPKHEFDWDGFERRIIDSIDIQQEYTDLGLRIPDGATVDNEGWLKCHAIDREDATPSAGINVGGNGARGMYNDFGGGTFMIWRFAEKFCPGRFRDWREHRRYLARKVGLDKGMPREGKGAPEERVHLKSKLFNDGMMPYLKAFGGLEKRYPGITNESIRVCGGVMAEYQKQLVVAFPAYGPSLFSLPPNGYVIMRVDGEDIKQFIGNGKPPNVLSRVMIGSDYGSGLLGTYGLKHLGQATHVFKMEGPTDMLAMQALMMREIPDPEERKNFAIITNACGASDKTLAEKVAHLFKGKQFFICHDCDEAGYNGAEYWINALSDPELDVSIHNYYPPYKRRKKHGFDWRDYITGRQDSNEQ